MPPKATIGDSGMFSLDGAGGDIEVERKERVRPKEQRDGADLKKMEKNLIRKVLDQVE